MSNIIDEKLFKQIFGDRCEILANKLMNTTNKEENHIIVSNIEKNKDKLYEEEEEEEEEEETSYGYDYVIQPSDRRTDLIDAIKLILDFNKTI